MTQCHETMSTLFRHCNKSNIFFIYNKACLFLLESSCLSLSGLVGIWTRTETNIVIAMTSTPNAVICVAKRIPRMAITSAGSEALNNKDPIQLFPKQRSLTRIIVKATVKLILNSMSSIMLRQSVVRMRFNISITFLCY